MEPEQKDDYLDKKQRDREILVEIRELERISANPYHGRMDLTVNGERRKCYIGDNEYQSKRGNSIITTYSTIGSYFRNRQIVSFTIGRSEYEVLLRRRIIISNHQLDSYYDEYDKGSAAGRYEITDPFLKRILELKRSEKGIGSIIGSIQDNQNDIIETDLHKNIIVQGCAGSGKTMIMLHRLANIKYNHRDLDWDRVRIITPNENFSFYIDDLSRNLRIDDIERITLKAYYFELLVWYYDTYLETIEEGSIKKKVHSKKVRFLGDKKNSKSIEESLELSDIIYSEHFRRHLQKEAALWNRQRPSMHFGETEMVFLSFLKKYGLGERDDLDYASEALLYAKVLFMFYYYGPIRNNYLLLFIDEAQSINERHYELINLVNAGKTYLNIFGDLNQRIGDRYNVYSWQNVSAIINGQYFELKENYRNSDNIIHFYNSRLDHKDLSFGIECRSVYSFTREELGFLAGLQLLLKNRTVIITNNNKDIPNSLKEYCVFGKTETGKISVMKVSEAKGLEFDTAFVFDRDLDSAERYIAYTRALTELYVEPAQDVEDALGVIGVKKKTGETVKSKAIVSVAANSKTRRTTTGRTTKKVKVTEADLSIKESNNDKNTDDSDVSLIFPDDAMCFTFASIKNVKRKKPYGISIDGDVLQSPYWTNLLEAVVDKCVQDYSINIADLCNRKYGCLVADDSGKKNNYQFFVQGKVASSSYKYFRKYNLSVYYGGANSIIEVMEKLLCDYLGIRANRVEIYYHS